MSALLQRWAALAPRERQMLGTVGALLAVVLLWLLAVQPALDTLRTAPQAQAVLNAQWQAMQRDAAEAQRLRGAPPLAPALAAQALQGATERLGAAGRLSLQGERAVLTLTDAAPEAIVAWLTEARRGARARPVEARLTAVPGGSPNLNGTIVVATGGGA